MPRHSPPPRAEGIADAVQRARKAVLELMNLRAQLVELRIEREHARALSNDANSSS